MPRGPVFGVSVRTRAPRAYKSTGGPGVSPAWNFVGHGSLSTRDGGRYNALFRSDQQMTMGGDAKTRGEDRVGTIGLDPAASDPTVERRRGPRDEVDAAADWLVARHGAGIAWRDMALVVPGKRKWRDPVIAVLDARAIPHRLLIGHPGAVPDLQDDIVHAMSLYTAAEHAPSVVAIVGLGDLPWKQQPLDEAVDMVRRTLARATGASRLSWSRDSGLTDRLGLMARPASP